MQRVEQTISRMVRNARAEAALASLGHYTRRDDQCSNNRDRTGYICKEIALKNNAIGELLEEFHAIQNHTDGRYAADGY